MKKYFKNNKIKKFSGFSLVEMIVALALFGVVSVVGVGSLLTILDVNRRAHTTETAFSNIIFLVDSMQREFRDGLEFYCDSSSANIDFSEVRGDCPNGSEGNAIIFYEDSTKANKTGYYFVASTPQNANKGKIYRKEGSSGAEIAITPDELNITEFKIKLVGSEDIEKDQPLITISIGGKVLGTKKGQKYETPFNITFTTSSRNLDI